MKKEILNKLNQIKPNEIIFSIPKKDEIYWTISLFKENLLIKFSANLGQDDLINVTLEKSKKKIKFYFS
jgi:hypothetical protein